MPAVIESSITGSGFETGWQTQTYLLEVSAVVCRHLCWWRHSPQLPDLCLSTAVTWEIPWFSHISTIQVKNESAARGYGGTAVCCKGWGEMGGSPFRDYLWPLKLLQVGTTTTCSRMFTSIAAIKDSNRGHLDTSPLLAEVGVFCLQILPWAAA